MSVLTWLKKDWSGRSMCEPRNSYELFIEWSLSTCNMLIGAIAMLQILEAYT